jgi:Secretion system C-terminal sorting domain
VASVSNLDVCSGSSNTFNVIGGLNYSWSPTTGLSATNVANPTVTPLSTTTYNINVSDGGVCVQHLSATATVRPLPNPVMVTVNPQDSICKDNTGNVLLSTTGTGSFIYAFDGITSATALRPIISFTTGTHSGSITTSNSFGCTTTSSKNFFVFDPIIVDSTKFNGSNHTFRAWGQFGFQITLYVVGSTTHVYHPLTPNTTSLAIFSGVNMHNGDLVYFEASFAGGCQTEVVEIGVGINEFSAENKELNAYPNPFSTDVTIELEGKNNEVTLTNMIGELIARYESDEKTFTLPGATLANGVYFVQVKNKDGIYIKKLVKQ